MIASELNTFCNCEVCVVDKDSPECKQILETDGFVQATDVDGCGFPLIRSKDIIIEAAKLERYTFDTTDACTIMCHKPNGLMGSPPDYFHDHTAIQRLVDGMDENKMVAYSDFLFVLVNGYEPNLEDMSFEELVNLLKATCTQKLEAILKANGVWKEE